MVDEKEMENKDFYTLKKNLRKIGYLSGYVPILAVFWLAIQAINLIQWIRYDARRIIMEMIK